VEHCVTDHDGRPTRVIGVNLDITARKQAEAAQQKLLAEVSRSNTDLEQFAYVASHDLKAPLRAIDSLASWLQEDLAPVLTPDSLRHLELLRQRALRMERLLDDLLDYSRAGRTAADLVKVDVGKLVLDISELLNPPPSFIIQPPQLAPVFTTAVTPLRQVLTNLIANAIKHHDQQKGVVQVGAREMGEFYEFSVEDDGPGILPEFHERIFGMFQTLRPRDEIEGSGIGLALVKRIVTRYGGVVTVECRQPRGSIFRFRWPKEITDP
jgi:light-regulated signal transduction histidine kinase (bacteriophytochrome)